MVCVWLWNRKQDFPCNAVEGFLPNWKSQRSLSNICHPYSCFKNHGIIFTLFHFWHLQERHPFQQHYFLKAAESPLSGLELRRANSTLDELHYAFYPLLSSVERISVDETVSRTVSLSMVLNPPHSGYKLLWLLPAYSLSNSFEFCCFLSLPVWFCCHGYISDPDCLPEMPVPVVEGGRRDGNGRSKAASALSGNFTEQCTISYIN